MAGRVVLAERTGTLRTFDPQSPRTGPPFTAHAAPVRALATHPATALVASIGWDGAVVLTRLAGDRLDKVASAVAARPRAICFSTDGSLLLVGGEDGWITTFTVPELVQVDSIYASLVDIGTLASTVDNEIVSVGLDGRSELWHPKPFSGIAEFRLPLSVPYGIVSGSPDGTLVGWDVDGSLLRLRPGAHQFSTVVASDAPPEFGARNGGQVVLLGNNQLEIWDVESWPPRRIAGPTAFPTTSQARAAPVLDGRRIVVLTEGRIRLVDPTTGAVVATAPVNGAPVAVSPISNDELIIATKATIGRWQVDPSTLTFTRPLAEAPPGLRYDAIAVAPDRTQAVAAVAGRSGTALMRFDIRSATLINPTISIDAAEMSHIAWSDDGRSIAATTPGGYLSVWDVATAKPRTGVLTALNALVTGLALSSDGARVYATATDLRLRVWDVASGDQLGGDALIFAEHPLGMMLVPPAGTVLVTGDGARLESIDTNPDRAADRACRALGRDLSRDEWETYLPDDDYRRTCSELPAAG